ncbi:MAG TPA: SlyX family protein [Devosiaceae bacterium]|nr:SlyX family protein [Devosiaceae bacterium]
MENSEALAARIEKLETLVAFQDQAIEDLSKTVTDQWKIIETLKRELAGLGAQVREVETHPALSVTPDAPPPHY